MVDLKHNETIKGAPNGVTENRLRVIINRQERPAGVVSWYAEYGVDFDGDPCFKLQFHVIERRRLTDVEIDGLINFKHVVRQALADSSLLGDLFPYIEVL